MIARTTGQRTQEAPLDDFFIFSLLLSATLPYVVMSVIQSIAIVEWLKALGKSDWVAFPAGIVVGFIPIVGTVCAIRGVLVARQWSVGKALAVFLVLPAVLLALAWVT